MSRRIAIEFDDEADKCVRDVQHAIINLENSDFLVFYNSLSF